MEKTVTKKVNAFFKENWKIFRKSFTKRCGREVIYEVLIDLATYLAMAILIGTAFYIIFYFASELKGMVSLLESVKSGSNTFSSPATRETFASYYPAWTSFLWKTSLTLIATYILSSLILGVGKSFVWKFVNNNEISRTYIVRFVLITLAWFVLAGVIFSLPLLFSGNITSIITALMLFVLSIYFLPLLYSNSYEKIDVSLKHDYNALIVKFLKFLFVILVSLVILIVVMNLILLFGTLLPWLSLTLLLLFLLLFNAWNRRYIKEFDNVNKEIRNQKNDEK